MIDRRVFLNGLASSLLLTPTTAGAQPASKTPRIGFLGLASAVSHAPRTEAFRAGLRDLGYIEGRNILIEFRWADGHYDRLPELATELVRLNVNVIVTHGAAGAVAAKQATTTIPIVIAATGDILALGLVQSLAQPGGNITGSTFFNPELAAKRLELLKEAIPPLSRAGLVSNPNNPINGSIVQAMEETARSLKVELRQFETRGPSQLESTFSAMVRARVGGIVIHEDTILLANAKPIADLAARHRLPGSGFPEFARAGGLMGYGISFTDMDRRAATFVDKIQKGANPARLPVERATTFKLILNFKTVKALGLTMPPSLLQRADEAIQ